MLTVADVTEHPGFDALSDSDQDTIIAFQQTLERLAHSQQFEGFFDGDLHLLAPQINDREDFMVFPDGHIGIAPSTPTEERKNDE
jgi:hypothetical protein